MSPELVERRIEEGVAVELWRRGATLEVRRDERPIMRSDRRRAEVQLAELALAPLGQRDDIAVLLAGLGMGLTLRALLELPGVQRVDVVEASPALLDWEARYFAGLNGNVRADPRVRLHATDLSAFVKARRGGGAAGSEGYLALILDMDEGPTTLGRAENASFYTDPGLERLKTTLRPGGVLALWSARREPELLQRLNVQLRNVAEVAVPVELDDGPSLDYVYRGRRPPLAATAHGPLN